MAAITVNVPDDCVTVEEGSVTDHSPRIHYSDESNLVPVDALLSFFGKKHRFIFWPMSMLQSQLQSVFMGEDFWINLKTTTFFLYLSQKGVLSDPYWLTEVLQKMYTTSLSKMKNNGTLNPPFKRKHEGPKVALIRHNKKKSHDREVGESSVSSSDDGDNASGKKRRSKRSSPLGRSSAESISRAGSSDSMDSAGGGRGGGSTKMMSDNSVEEVPLSEYTSSPSKKDNIASTVPLLKLPSGVSGSSSGGESPLPKLDITEYSDRAPAKANTNVTNSSEANGSRPRSPRNMTETSKLFSPDVSSKIDREIDEISKPCDPSAQCDPKETRSTSGKNSPSPRGALPALKTESLARLTVSTTANESVSKILGTSVEKFLSKDDDTIGQAYMQSKHPPLDRKMRHSITAIDTTAITAAQRLPPLTQTANAGSLSPRNVNESPAQSSPLSARRLKRLESYEKAKGGAN